MKEERNVEDTAAYETKTCPGIQMYVEQSGHEYSPLFVVY